MSVLNAVLLDEWQEIRRLTYAYLAVLTPADLERRLPFPQSQPLGYQFWCMIGAHESYLRKLETGTWQGFASSLDGFDEVTPAIIEGQMRRGDAELSRVLQTIDLEAPLANGQPGYSVVMQMIKHEMHHHGQMINYLYALQLPIPSLWRDEWALRRG